MAEPTERFGFRLTASNRKLIERAAQLLGQPLTAFAVQVLVEQSEKVIAQDTNRKLSARDWKRFLEVLDDETVSPLLLERPSGTASAPANSSGRTSTCGSSMRCLR